jgi:hypothetical protein
MKTYYWHVLWIVAIGYLLGYYFRGLGNATVAKLYAPKS